MAGVSSPKKGQAKREFRVGKVKGYLRGRVWYLCYYEHGQRRRPRVGEDIAEAKRLAAQVNGQLAGQVPSMFAFESISVAELRQRWLDHHEHVLRSSLATISRYRTATDHLIRYLDEASSSDRLVSQFATRSAEEFVRYLRSIQVAPNWHAHSARRPLSTHLLIEEDLDLEGGSIRIQNKVDLGWQVKTRNERTIPLVRALVNELARLIDGRSHGPVFRRQRFDPESRTSASMPIRSAAKQQLSKAEQKLGRPLNRTERQKVLAKVWWEAGIVKPDRIRTSFIHRAQSIGRPDCTAPKPFRHASTTSPATC